MDRFVGYAVRTVNVAKGTHSVPYLKPSHPAPIRGQLPG
jgi:hypothetical protein